MSGKYKAGTGGVNTGKQRTYTGAYSGDTVERNTSKVAGDVPCNLTTRDSVRKGADHPDLGTYPGPTPNYYISGDAGKMGKRLTHPDVDPDGSRALQESWHRKAGFSGVVSDTYNEQGGTHPKYGPTSGGLNRARSGKLGGSDTQTDVRSGWGADNDTAGQGSPKSAKFSWQ